MLCENVSMIISPANITKGIAFSLVLVVLYACIRMKIQHHTYSNLFRFFFNKIKRPFTCSSQRSLLYFPYSTIPPNTSNLVPSQTNPQAAQPGGISPRTAGINHWFVAREQQGIFLMHEIYQQLYTLHTTMAD